MADIKWLQFPSATPGDSDEVVGIYNNDNARFSVASFVYKIRQGLANIFVPKTDVGAANGVASLDNTGKVPSSQLPPIASTAADVTYDNTGSGLSATDVQDAIDELAQGAGDKANQAQLAYVETGTTASRNYTAGEYICWNGLTYTADTNIATGTTLSASGGGKNLTECVGGGLNLLNVFPSIKLAQTINVNVPDGGTNFVFSHTATKKENVYVSARTRFKGDNDSASTNGVYELAIRLNTDFVVSNQLPFVTRGYRSISASFMCQLQVGDTLAVRVFQTSGVALDVDGFVYFGAAS